jgi:hypothetical protein
MSSSWGGACVQSGWYVGGIDDNGALVCNSLSELLLSLALIRKKALTKEAYAIIMTCKKQRRFPC